MKQLEVFRMHGLGNTVLLVDRRAVAGRDSGALARRWCNEANADAMLLHELDEAGACDVEIRNADGSPAELCGNGLRCLVRLGCDEGWWTDGVRLRTPAGAHEGSMESDLVRVSMPAPAFGLEAVAARSEQLPGETTGEGACIVMDFDGVGMDLHLVSTGNPHVVIPCRDAAALETIDVIGPVLERHPAFPAGINVHLVQVVAADRLRLRSWERGVGPTRACATGATAAAAATARAGLADVGATVDMPGGALEVECDPDSDVVWNRGPADYLDPVVFDLD